MIKIRRMTEDDIPMLVALGEDMHEESRRSGTFDPERSIRLCFKIMQDPASLGLVAEQEGEIIGMLGAHITDDLWGPDKVAGDYLVYVVPEQRGTSAAVRLIKAYIAWAEENGAADIYLRQSTGVDIERTAEFYGRIGFDMVGHTFKLRSNHA